MLERKPMSVWSCYSVGPMMMMMMLLLLLGCLLLGAGADVDGFGGYDDDDGEDHDDTYYAYSPITERAEMLDLCISPVYCQGELLKTVQLAAIYRDSKTFVDLYQRNDENVTLDNFQQMMKETKYNPSKRDIEIFVASNFEEATELLNATLPDWTPKPRILDRIKDPRYQKWAADLNEVWKGLARRMTTDVRDNPKRHSLIYVNNTFIIPGGRFKEFYYWDSYWVVKGLLLHDMHDTARGIIENFLSMVRTYGFIPNGGRVYYLMRSQPPFLIPMVEKYFEATNDAGFLDRNLPILEKEFKFWQRYRSVNVVKNGKTYTLARYITNSEGPRPESYREDYLLAVNLSDTSKRAFYNNIKAGAESGWDFSARWFVGPGGKLSLDLADINTEDIIPVDLNALLEKNARTLAGFYQKKNYTVKAKQYLAIADDFKEAIEKVLWNDHDGIWYDYNLRHKKPRAIFYPSNLMPLYTMSYNASLAAIYGNFTVEYLRAKGITNYPGGTPSSLENTSQQWDFPNAWPPLQDIVVQGLHKTCYKPAMDLARNLAYTWLKSNYMGFNETKKMFEKYDATVPGKFGGGGEYDVQEGFGWTNGVVLEFLHNYPNASYHHSVKESPTNGMRKIPVSQAPRPVLKSIWSHYASTKS